MKKNLKILIIEDSQDDIELIQRELKKSAIAFTSRIVSNKTDFENSLKEFKPDIILSDHSLPQFNSIEALKISKEHQRESHCFIPFILVTGSVSEEFAVQSIKGGADDYILKDRLKRLPASIESALEKAKVEAESKRHLRAIEQQNEKLKEIAWIQSHEVRAPLARMMGLISLIDNGNQLEKSVEDVLGKIVVSAKELDSIIRKIVRQTEAIEEEELKNGF